jgi:hypothetical protein
VLDFFSCSGFEHVGHGDASVPASVLSADLARSDSWNNVEEYSYNGVKEVLFKMVLHARNPTQASFDALLAAVRNEVDTEASLVRTFLNMIYPASVSIANRFDTFAHFDALAEIDDAGLRMRY